MFDRCYFFPIYLLDVLNLTQFGQFVAELSLGPVPFAGPRVRPLDLALAPQPVANKVLVDLVTGRH